MKNSKFKIQNYLALMAVCYLLLTNTGYSQGDTAVKQFSLQAAIDYALAHNFTYLNADNDTKISSYRKKEIIGQGLPQIKGSVDLRDNLVLPTQLIPAKALNPMASPNDYLFAKFGVAYNLTASANISQLI